MSGRAARLAAAAALSVLTACGGSDLPMPRADDPTPTETASPTKKPRPKRSKTPTPKPTPKPTPTATTPPPATGDPVGTAEALVHVVEPGEPKPPSDCAGLAPDMTRPVCTAVKLDAGQVVAVTGRLDGRKALRLMVPADGGYVARYEGRDDGRSWAQTRVFAAPLTGRGVDGLVFFVRLVDGAGTYDVLTWFPGGPLVLRAHREPLADGRAVPRDGALDEYARATDGSYVLRRLAWDGRRFLISAGRRVSAPPG